MTDVLLPILTAALFIAEFLAALTCFILRDFSRSRLDDVCRQRGREERFSIVLKRAEPALLAAELLLTVVSLTLVVIVFSWLELWSGPSTANVIGWAAYLAKLVLLLLALFFGAVIVPWIVARVAGERFLFRVWPVITILLVVAKPLLSLTRQIDKIAHRLTGLQEPADGDAATITEEIMSVVDEGQREGLLESEARTMIHRVMELQEDDVANIMTPRTDMVTIHAERSLEEARQTLLAAGHSRLPVIGKSTDDVVGILYAKDLLKHMDATNGQARSVREIVREPFYVPETTGIDTLLETMKRKRVHLGIVLDEYGGVAGLVTMEDILEEIVGEIVDEYDAAQEVSIRELAPGVHEIDARVHIDDLNEQLSYGLPEDGDFDTLGGFTTTQLGRVPEANDSFTWRSLRITVLDADKRKINKLKIEVDPSLAAAASADEA